MSHIDELQLAFVLHSRAWRETSLLLDVFTQHHGKLGLCARGVRSKKSPKRSLLQPFTPLLLNWKGRGELPTMMTVEPAGPAIRLSGDALFSAFYINELIVRLLHRHDPHPELFHQYQQTLLLLSKMEELEPVLRQFELQLLQSIGYGLTLDCDIDGEPLAKEQYYLLHNDGFLQLIQQKSSTEHPRAFFGASLISIANDNWQNSDVVKDAKRLLRLSLQPLLGDKPLQSRKLFRRKVS